MHIRLLAVGDRQPEWVDRAFQSYIERFPREWRFRLETIASAKRPKNAPRMRAREIEGQQLLAKIGADEQVVLVDERGKQVTSRELATNLSSWQSDGRNISFIIGGPDGAADDCHKRANSSWSLSNLTLPHGLARVLFAEQLYRAWSLLAGHPYHRD